MKTITVTETEEHFSVTLHRSENKSLRFTCEKARWAEQRVWEFAVQQLLHPSTFLKGERGPAQATVAATSEPRPLSRDYFG